MRVQQAPRRTRILDIQKNRDVIGRTIARCGKVAIAEAESIIKKDREDYKSDVILFTPADVKREQGERTTPLRGAGSSLNTSDGDIEPSFALRHTAKLKWDNSFGANSLSSSIYSFDEMIQEGSETKRSIACTEIGKRMAAGWMLLDDSCPSWVMPAPTMDSTEQQNCALSGVVNTFQCNEDSTIEPNKLQTKEHSTTISYKSEVRKTKPTRHLQTKGRSLADKPASLVLHIKRKTEKENEKNSPCSGEVIQLKHYPVKSSLPMKCDMEKEKTSAVTSILKRTPNSVSPLCDDGTPPRTQVQMSSPDQVRAAPSPRSPRLGLYESCPSPKGNKANIVVDGAADECGCEQPKIACVTPSPNSHARRADAVASDAFESILSRIEKCKTDLLDDDVDIKTQIDTAQLIEQLAQAAVAMKNLGNING